MNNLLKIPNLSYSYDFSTPKVVKSENANHDEFNFYVKDKEILGLFGSEIEFLHLDWIDIAIAVYTADRLSLREINKYGSNWKR